MTNIYRPKSERPPSKLKLADGLPTYLQSDVFLTLY